MFTAYWGGYFDSPLTLDLTPACIDIITLAFAGPLPNNVVEVSYLCSRYSEATVVKWIREVQKRGKKVTLSLLDTPLTHWNVVDKRKFAKSVALLVDSWHLDGVDIDAESGMPEDDFVPNFIELITELRSALGENRIISYTCFTGTGGPDGAILAAVHPLLSYVQLMAYFYDNQQMQTLFNAYAQLIAPSKLIIGVKAGNDKSSTPLAEVRKLAKWKPAAKGGIMLWTINRDMPKFTGHVPWTWVETIKQNIKST